MRSKGQWPVNRWVVLAILGLLTILPMLTVTVSAQDDTEFGLSLFAEGFDRPVWMVDTNDGTGRMFVVEQGGLIRVFQEGEIMEEPLLDISGLVTRGSEQGLLGLALHPEFAENGSLFINYTSSIGDTQVVRYQVSDEDPNRLDTGSAVVILSVEQPARNHNGGMLAFGPDGYLYVALGDGGGRGDPREHAQDVGTLLGSILRIDIDSEPVSGGYAIPVDNPFVGVEGARAEIWSYGFRNPWRFSFDRETGDLWIGDVGQNAFEEVDRQPAGVGGLNFGWNLAEGFSCFAAPECETAAIVWPVFTYGRELGISVIGGYVYNGESVPSLAGKYLLGDYGTGFIWILTPEDDGSYSASEPIPTDLTISSFAEDAEGELYVINLGGSIHKIVSE